jgi:hypothetical protein
VFDILDKVAEAVAPLMKFGAFTIRFVAKNFAVAVRDNG